jgi:hypothetical protein
MRTWNILVHSRDARIWSCVPPTSFRQAGQNARYIWLPQPKFCFSGQCVQQWNVGIQLEAWMACQLALGFFMCFFLLKNLNFFNFERSPWTKIDVSYVTGLHGAVWYSSLSIGSSAPWNVEEKSHLGGLKHTTHKIVLSVIVFGGACAVLCAFPVKKFRTEHAPHLNNSKDAPLALFVYVLRVIRHPHCPIYLLSPGHTVLALIKIIYYPAPLGHFTLN